MKPINTSSQTSDEHFVRAIHQIWIMSFEIVFTLQKATEQNTRSYLIMTKLIKHRSTVHYFN